MSVSKELAKKIVSDIEEIIQYKINFMNAEGIIIASTDLTRLGTFHEGAYQCALTGQPIIIKSDTEYIGAKKGINIPVSMNNEVVGVIGITGDAEEVKTYGRIVKQMTEILLTEQWIKKNRLREKEMERNTIEYLIFSGDYQNLPLPPGLIREKKFVVVATPDQHVASHDQPMDLYDWIKRTQVQDYNHYLANFANEVIFIFWDLDEGTLEKLLDKIHHKLKKDAGIDLYFGLSPAFEDLSSIRVEYRKAKSANRWLKKYYKNQFCLAYQAMDLGLLLSNIPESSVKAFQTRVLENLSEEEIKEYKKLMTEYADHNGSIKNTAESLFVHKNTVQYRLNKLHKLTGYNPRNLRDFVILMLAFEIA